MNIERNNNQAAQISLCETCQKFYGNPATENLCSSCFRTKQNSTQAKKSQYEAPMEVEKPMIVQ